MINAYTLESAGNIGMPDISSLAWQTNAFLTASLRFGFNNLDTMRLCTLVLELMAKPDTGNIQSELSVKAQAVFWSTVLNCRTLYQMVTSHSLFTSVMVSTRDTRQTSVRVGMHTGCG